jgi:hypothetical protein
MSEEKITAAVEELADEPESPNLTLPAVSTISWDC